MIWALKLLPPMFVVANVVWRRGSLYTARRLERGRDSKQVPKQAPLPRFADADPPGLSITVDADLLPISALRSCCFCSSRFKRDSRAGLVPTFTIAFG